VVRRALPAAREYAIDDAVSTAVAEYNDLPKPTTAPQYQAAFTAMQKVERRVYDWFDTFTEAHQSFKDDAGVAKMSDLLDKLAVEHRTMIESSKNLTDVLPFDPAGLDPTTLAAMKSLWQDIVNSRGKVKLVGSDAFNQEALSQLGRILSTPTGRQMLTFLNSPPPKGYRKGEKPELTNVYIGEAVAQLPAEVRAASPDLEDRERAEAQPLNIAEGQGRTVEAMTAVTMSKPYFKPSANDYPRVDATHLSVIRDAITSGKSGFMYNDRKFKFNSSRTGAFVTNVETPSMHPAKGTGHQILSPTWVTLGHELGHVVNMRGGATTLKANELSSLGGTGAEAEKWDNPEELLNIENIENAIRSEAGLTERFGHRPPDWLLSKAPKVRTALRRPLDEMYRLDADHFSTRTNPEWDALYKRVTTMKAHDAVDREKIDVLKAEVKKFIDDKTVDGPEVKLRTAATAKYDQGLREIDEALAA
jgi:hypothetical protein